MPSPAPREHQLPFDMEYTNEEIHRLCSFTPHQLQFLRSLHARVIKDRLKLMYDVQNPLMSIQEDAYLKARGELLYELQNLHIYYPVDPTPTNKE